MEIKEPPKKGADHIDRSRTDGALHGSGTQEHLTTVTPLKEKVTPPEGDINAQDKQATSTLETATTLETIDARDECVQEYISGLVHKTPPMHTTGPQTRNHKIRDTANYWEPITVSDIEETPQVDQLVDAGRPTALRLRRTSRSWRGVSLQPKTQVSTRCIGYADADCTGSYLRLDCLAGCLDSYPSHQRF
jgi:hypothetical protein